MPLTTVGMGLSSRLEELRSESLSLETTGTDKSRGGRDDFLLLGQWAREGLPLATCHHRVA